MRRYKPRELKLGHFYKNGPWYYLYIGRDLYLDNYYNFVEYSLTDKQYRNFRNITIFLQKKDLYFE